MSQTSTTQITTKTKNRKNYLSYPYDFFCGANARIFFNHVWVDDIITIQYDMKQNKLPVYGYSSQQFDVVAKGQILVNGSFTIAFKEAGYLTLINNEIKNLSSIKKKNSQEILNYWLGKGETIEKQLDTLYMKTEGDSSNQDFEDLAEALEDYIWHIPNNTSRRIVRPDEFDDNGKGGINRDGFDIVLTFGDYTDPAAEHTVKTINGIHIIEESTIVTPDGNPIGMNYTFFARGMDEGISNVYNIPDNKKPEQEGKDSIGDKLDAQNATTFNVTILEAWTKSADKITNMSGKEFFGWAESYIDRSELRKNIFPFNANDTTAVDNFRSALKTTIQSVMNKIDLSTLRGGSYSDLSAMKFDVQLELEDNRLPDTLVAADAPQIYGVEEEPK